MFETTLKETLLRIFDLPGADFGRMNPEAPEQKKLFIEIEKAIPRVKQGLATARVEGRIRVNADATQMPFGYFAKKIEQAQPEDVRHFFFYDFEESALRFRDLVERSVSFIYFFSGQYDPEAGSMTSINLQTEVE